MKRRVGLTRAGLIGAVLGGAGSVSSAVLAQPAAAADIPVKALVQTEPVPYWWFGGFVEVGGRDFLNDPQRNGQTAVYLNKNLPFPTVALTNQKSLAKYYEYSSIKPGPFSNFTMSTGSKDGLYQIDFGGKNVGYSDQNYYVDMSKAGQHYLDLIWDQTPHVYSTSAQTPYLGVGTNALTLPAGCASRLNTTAVVVTSANCLQPTTTDVGIRRDTASVEYRWTPTDAWDVKAELSNLHRSGTQVDGVVGMAASSVFSSPFQVIKPVSDTTQNFGVNGEYAGTSWWNQKYTFKVGYQGSLYNDDLSSYTIQNPYCTGNTCEVATLSPFARLSLPPSNQMNAVSSTLAVDLPFTSRYVGTVNYTMMTQNAAFIPITNNPNASAAVAGVLPALNGVNQTSLNGSINTLLSNNVVTTQITPYLTSKASYRYYDFQNNTPELLLGTLASGTANVWPSYDQSVLSEKTLRSLSLGYIKQNAGEELTWRPSRDWHLGVAYGYERYDYTRVDATSTDENSVKAFADWKPTSWVTLRSSGSYSDRTANNYNYVANVGSIQFPTTTPANNNWYYNSAYRQFLIDDRQRTKANFFMDIVVVRGLTITPSFKYQDDHYGLNPLTQLGLTDSSSWNGGIDVTYVLNPDIAFTVGYLREFYNQQLYGLSSTSATAVLGVGGVFSANTSDHSTVSTITAAVRYAAIPNKLDLDFRYTASLAIDSQQLLLGNNTNPVCPATMPVGSNCQFPDVRTSFQRLEAIAVYKFDQDLVSQLGLKGQVRAKLRYAWERNAVTNWQNDPLAPYSPIVTTQGIWLASNNPNYNVQLLAASLAYAW
jgi:MtrB/PioB family decaheme-associated outer membrane protein